MRERLRMIYAATLAAVIARCGVTLAGMARSRKAECCLARAVLVLTLLRLGITEPTVRELTGMSQQRVNYIKNSPPQRLAHLEGRILSARVWGDVKRFKDEEGEDEEEE